MSSSSTGKSGDTPPPAWYGNLVSWIRKQGGEIHDALTLEVIDESSRGIKATADIAEGSLLIRLPSKLALDGSRLPTTYEVKGDSDDGSDVTRSERMASSWLRCLTSLLTESATSRGNSPKAGEGVVNFAPYLSSLPQSYDTLTDDSSWSDEDVSALLAGTALGTMVAEERKSDMMKKRYQVSIAPYLRHVGLLSKDSNDASEGDYTDFKRACACVSTRGFHLQQGEQQGKQPQASKGETDYSGPFLLAFIDLLNHSAERKCTTLQRDAADESFVMIAERNIKRGEEIFHTYGTGLTSAQQLQTFGFVETGAAMRAANNQWNNDSYGITPATLSAAAVLSACRSVIGSSFPTDLKRAMEQNDFEDETWDVTAGKDRDLLNNGLISNDILIATDDGPMLSDELVTLCCLPFLPDEVYAEWSEEPCLWSADVLDDYFLGKLALRALMKAIGAKLGEYTAVNALSCGLGEGVAETDEGDGDEKLLSRLLEATNAVDDAKRSRAVHALTVRLEEKHCINLLKKEIIDTLKGLDDDEEGNFDEDDGTTRDDSAASGGKRQNDDVDNGGDTAADSSSKKIKL